MVNGIKHIDEKDADFIAKNNRMSNVITERNEIINVSECLEFDKHDMTTCKIASLKNSFPVKCSMCHNCYFKLMKREQNRRIELENYMVKLENKNRELEERNEKTINKYLKYFLVLTRIQDQIGTLIDEVLK